MRTFLARTTAGKPIVLVATLTVAVVIGALSVPAASATTPGPHTSPTATPPMGPVADHGSAAAPGQASVTVQITAAQPTVLAALAGTTVHTRQARRAALLGAAPSNATTSAVAEFLSRSGLTITARNVFSLTASGPRARISALFPAARAAGAVRPRTAATALTSPLVIPAGLTGLASSIVGGTDTRRVAYPRYVRAAPAAAPSFAAAPITGLSARTLYGVPTAATTAPGQGITVATIQFSGWNSSDLTAFATDLGVPDPVHSGQYRAVSVDGASPTTPDGTGGDVEVALDQEALLTTAPRANQVAYVAPNTTQGFVDAFNAVAADALAGPGGHRYTALSVSWGQCEAGWSPADINAMHAAIQNVVAAGVTVFAASGDSGAYDCSTQTAPNDTLAVDYPASDPNVIAVGGLTTDPVARAEKTWWQPSGGVIPGFLGAGGGGGLSAFWPKPAWQGGRQSGSTARLVPDISLDADPSSGLWIRYLGNQHLVGGTSLAAPLAAATLTDLQIADGAASTYGLGNISASLYAAPSTSFRDTTSGTNGYYLAAAGYDLATGLGAPLWSRLRTAIEIGPGASSGYTPTDPCRLFDTRTGSGSCPDGPTVGAGPLGAGQALLVQVAGTSGVPTNATAVVLNLTAVGATAPTYVTAWPTGTARSAVSTLNPNSSGAVPNLAIVRVGAGGSVSFYNASGNIQLVVDLVGYFAPGTGAKYATTGPCRAFDTRSGLGTCPGAAGVDKAPLGTGQTLRIKVSAVAGIPADATAVVLNLTAVGATATSYLTAWADGTTRPVVSNLNPSQNQGPSPNLAVVPIGANGYIDLYNATGSVDLIADVVGYFSPTAHSAYATTGPCRVFDTRSGPGTCPGAFSIAKAPLGPGKTLRIKVSAVAGIPAKVTAVVLNLTAVGATATTYLTAWADGTTRPVVSNLNPGQNKGPSPNLAVVPVGANGYIDLYNATGSVNLIADVAGYFAPS